MLLPPRLPLVFVGVPLRAGAFALRCGRRWWLPLVFAGGVAQEGEGGLLLLLLRRRLLLLLLPLLLLPSWLLLLLLRLHLPLLRPVLRRRLWS